MFSFVITVWALARAASLRYKSFSNPPITSSFTRLSSPCCAVYLFFSASPWLHSCSILMLSWLFCSARLRFSSNSALLAADSSKRSFSSALNLSASA